VQGEPREIPFAGALDILCRERIYAFPTLYAASTKNEDNAAEACLPQAGPFFSNLLQLANLLNRRGNSKHSKIVTLRIRREYEEPRTICIIT